MATTFDRRVLGCCLAAALSFVACAKASPPPAGPATPRPAPEAPTAASGQSKPVTPPSAAADAASAPAQAGPPPGGTASQNPPAVNADARALAAFQARVAEYIEMQRKLVASLPKLSKDSTPAQIDGHQRELAALIQSNRRGAKAGDIFTREARAVIRRLLARVFSDADGRQVRDSIMDENPGPLKLQVNGRYPDNVPLSTMPPQLLEGLPKLPPELEFRFIGPRLILMDVAAHIVADFIEDALPR